MVSENALEATDEVLTGLKSRKGFDGFWGMIDADIKENIRQEMAKRIDDVYSD